MPSRAERIATLSPSIRISPALAGVTPKMVSATLVRPEPTRPARPRISPRRSENDTSRNTPSSVRPRTSSTVSPISACCLGNSSVISRPTIMRISPSVSIWSAGLVAM